MNKTVYGFKSFESENDRVNGSPILSTGMKTLILRLAGSGTSSQLLDDVFNAHALPIPGSSSAWYPSLASMWYIFNSFLLLSVKTSESLSSAGLFGGAMSLAELQLCLDFGLLF